MKKKKNGFVLAETLIVTTFVAGVLIFLYIQLTNLSSNYEISHTYNTVDDLYALENIVKLISSDQGFSTYLSSNIESLKQINIKNCDNFTKKKYCLKLLELYNIDNIFVMKKDISDVIGSENIDEVFSSSTDSMKNFISKINTSGEEKYRVVASFKVNDKVRFATLRFGD